MPVSAMARESSVNSVRLQTFFELLAAKIGYGELQSCIAALSPAEAQVARTATSNSWIAAAIEEKILTALVERCDALELLEKSGSETFNIHLAGIIPALPAAGKESRSIFYLPGLLRLVNASYDARLMEEEAQLTIELENGADHVHDILYIKGLLRAFLNFLKKENAQILIPSLALESSAWPLPAEGIEFNGKTRFVIPDYADAPDPALVRGMATLGWGTSPRDAFVKQVVARSTKLIRDKRELSTAVEYLNVANDELDREIQENKRELTMARNIQKGMIPGTIPDWHGLQFFVYYAPLREVSGDIYDFIEIDQNTAGLLVGDVSGHGVPAALISAIAKISFQNHRHGRPAEVFSNVNLDMLNFVKMEGYLTAIYLRLQNDFTLSYSLAGIPGPFLLRYRTGELTRLPGTGTLLGMFLNASDFFSEESLILEPGDKLFIYTDGITESTDKTGQQFGEERLKAAILATREMNAEEASSAVLRSYRQFMLGSSVHDDMTLLVMAASLNKEEYDGHYRNYQEHRAAGRLTLALEALTAAVAISPRDPNCLLELGELLAHCRDYSQAIEVLKRHQQLKSNSAQAWTIQGYCHFKLGQYDQARSYLRRSLSIKRQNLSALYHLYRVCKAQGAEKEATEILLELKAMAPRNSIVQKLKLIG
ncbi:MAG: SpoIIE family protein phosphatase [Spirochaetales bacterium]|nr:SpoIIE family protein phosphatase [Spirochaetales bacterium]